MGQVSLSTFQLFPINPLVSSQILACSLTVLCWCYNNKIWVILYTHPCNLISQDGGFGACLSVAESAGVAASAGEEKSTWTEVSKLTVSRCDVLSAYWSLGITYLIQRYISYLRSGYKDTKN
ncbi:hypothetical protein HanXRQr2_Chr11g0478091 [Helianthus annuus]|uniref:Uncharacterized protein n=1 Tax=Helianthus annuus TaxID=4232 RepID=A0A251T8Z9_HELAN|nr:hypothetical protein HanXRQr2_Chr11g0478091 [Helianthus annuus]KAJ0500664.1 hypothetical protein HanHA300_Chr11g0391951 [Helianthus annuus]KAJ0508245.1 hypothetical protein HanIR_Chr11g0515101 [Helianthus annuus]KAJ0516542.1 hypothetical protein HanHA89_Chr11g0414981 [Helianthus annuus]